MSLIFAVDWLDMVFAQVVGAVEPGTFVRLQKKLEST